MPIKLHAKTVEECWKIARQEAEAYQRKMHRSRSHAELLACRAARNAADRIALTIRYGHQRNK